MSFTFSRPGVNKGTQSSDSHLNLCLYSKYNHTPHIEDVTDELLDPQPPVCQDAIPLFPDTWAQSLPPLEPPPTSTSSSVYDLSNDSDNAEPFTNKIFTTHTDPTSVLDPIYTTHHWTYRFAHDPGVLSDDIVHYDLPLGMGRFGKPHKHISPIYR